MTKTYRAKKTCDECGYERPVLVREWVLPNKTVELSFSKLCTACDYLRAARVHDAGARRARMMANSILERRQARRK